MSASRDELASAFGNLVSNAVRYTPDGDLAVQLQQRYFHLDDAGMELLVDACRRHTAGLLDAEPTVHTCWDADRLDLLRVGIPPRPDRHGTKAARMPAVIASANARALAQEFPHREAFMLPDGAPLS